MIILVTSNADIYNNLKFSFVLKTFLNSLNYRINDETKCFKFLNFTDNSEEANVSSCINQLIESANIITSDVSSIVDTITSKYNENAVMYVSDFNALSKNIEVLRKRPFFIHVHVEFEISLLLKILDVKSDNILEFINKTEKSKNYHAKVYDNPAMKINIKNSEKFSKLEKFEDSVLETSFREQLLKIPMFQSINLSTPQGRTSPLRPSWDEYFMQLANLASTRSNCMKRKVGCCIVSNNKVIATGYNGTPRNLLNCFSGGCKRCNVTSIDTTSPKTVHNLGTCYCLHAEENALLEAGNIRIDNTCTLYCDTCPCITCSVKIVQAGIGEVVYSQSYNMDGESIAIFDNAGIKIRQFDHAGIKTEYNFSIYKF